MQDIELLAWEYRHIPHTGIPSNEPYAPTPNDKAQLRERDRVRNDFINGDAPWPTLTYEQLDQPSLDVSERGYQQVLGGVIAHDKALGETPESEALYERGARKLAEVYRHKEVRRLLGSTASAAELSRNRAAAMSGELFGEPQREVVQELLAADVRIALAALNTEKGQIAADYLSLLGLDQTAAQELARITTKSYELQDAAMETIREDFYALFPNMREGMEHFAGRSARTQYKHAKPAFRTALGAFGLTRKGWKVEAVEGSRAADANAKTKQITFGKQRFGLRPESIVTTPIHEGIHALQYQNASEQDFEHLRSSLPDSLAFAEGLPTAIEQVISGKKRMPGEKYYLQLGLLKGLHLPEDEQAEQSFRTVYNIMWRRAALQEKGALEPATIATLQNDAYRAIMRTARGGARDNRDISYFEGARKATQFLNETAAMTPELRKQRLAWVLSGVFDPTIPKHAALFGGDPAHR